MKQWVDKLKKERTLNQEEFRQLLTHCDTETLRYISEQAREVSYGNSEIRFISAG